MTEWKFYSMRIINFKSRNIMCLSNRSTSRLSFLGIGIETKLSPFIALSSQFPFSVFQVFDSSLNTQHSDYGAATVAIIPVCVYLTVVFLDRFEIGKFPSCNLRRCFTRLLLGVEFSHFRLSPLGFDTLQNLSTSNYNT